MTIDLLAQIPEWEREASSHERKARALRQIIEGVRTLNGDAARLFGIDALMAASSLSEEPAEAPRGRAAVRRIVAERPGPWKVIEIKRQIQMRGWPYSASGVEAACRRLVADGEAERITKGVYRFGAHAPDVTDEEVLAA